MTPPRTASRRSASATGPALAVDVNVLVPRSPVAIARLEQIARMALRAERVSHAMLSITLMGNRGIAALNKKQLGHAGPTDVISFGFVRAAGGPVIGDVYIGVAVARANARTADVSLREEIARLVIHGILHVLGYDHPHGEARMHSLMWRRQETLVQRAVRVVLA
jgi:probable rRNA maturation factor